MASTWSYLAYTDKTEIRACVDCSVSNATGNGGTLGTTNAEKDASTDEISKHMSPSGGVHMEILCDKNHDVGLGPGRVAVFFHKMAWMSQYGLRDYGARDHFESVWVMSVAFDEAVLPPKTGPEAHHHQLIDNLTADDGPLRQFLDDNPISFSKPLTSLYVVGPKNAPHNTNIKKLGRFELVARDIATLPQTKWRIAGKTFVDQTYVGKDPTTSNPVPIPPKLVTKLWGKHLGNKFDLTEIEFL